MLWWHILSTISILLRQLNGALMKLRHLQSHPVITSSRKPENNTLILSRKSRSLYQLFFWYLLYLQDMGFILREGWRRRGRIQSTDQGASEHTSRFASSASLCSPGNIFTLASLARVYLSMFFLSDNICFSGNPGTKGLEGTSLAQPDSGDDHFNCCWWFQHLNALQHSEHTSVWASCLKDPVFVWKLLKVLLIVLFCPLLCSSVGLMAYFKNYTLSQLSRFHHGLIDFNCDKMSILNNILFYRNTSQ